MLAKLTSKNQLTLPESVVEAVGASEHFDVVVRDGQIVLTPVRIQRGDAVGAKLAAPGMNRTDVEDAVRWARAGGNSLEVSSPGGKGRVMVTCGRDLLALSGASGLPPVLSVAAFCRRYLGE